MGRRKPRSWKKLRAGQIAPHKEDVQTRTSKQKMRTSKWNQKGGAEAIKEP